ncbi:MAG TPA: hypothetical protein VME86_11790 [Acidobacteriaceae bacterium]|nr:hypothetical protein [Acidobacteriaceae bacterium]
MATADGEQTVHGGGTTGLIPIAAGDLGGPTVYASGVVGSGVRFNGPVRRI